MTRRRSVVRVEQLEGVCPIFNIQIILFRVKSKNFLSLQPLRNSPKTASFSTSLPGPTLRAFTTRNLTVPSVPFLPERSFRSEGPPILPW